MKAILFALPLSLLPLACASGGSEPVQAPPPPPPAPAAPPAAAAPEPAEPAPTAEEVAAAEAAQRQQAEWQQMEAAAQAEQARFTPELRQEVQALANTKWETSRAGLQKILSSNHRRPGHAARDAVRHPLETLEFFGLKPTMSVLEYGPGEGWYTELLAPLLAQGGSLAVTVTDPNGPREDRSTFYGRRTQLMLDKSPELFGKVERVVVDSKQPSLEAEGKYDLVLVIRGMHGWARQGKTATWLGEIHQALKPGGVHGVVQHRAAAGADPQTSAEGGYLPEAWVIEQVQAAGFKLQAKSEVNANPKDTKDHPDGVWSLPPTLRQGDGDRAKYEAIGESDRMTLKFVKTAK